VASSDGNADETADLGTVEPDKHRADREARRYTADRLTRARADVEGQMQCAQAMRSQPPSKTIAAAAVLLLGATMAVRAQSPAEQTEASNLVVSVLDDSQLPVPAARVEIRAGDQIIAEKSSDATGHAEFPCKPGRLTISAYREGFDTAVVQDFVCKPGGSVQLVLKPAATKQTIDVQDTISPADITSPASAVVERDVAKVLPSRPATVDDALPLIPGIVREPSGKLQLSGSGEHRSTMMVNSADVTDPATGGFGLTVPIDSVETINFYQTSFLAEYGRYSAGLVSVETRRGTEGWNWELNDPLPEFYIRSWHLQGLRTATPRLNFEGPLLAGKLYFSEGFEYVVRKTPLITLPFPWNQKKEQGFNSFSQVDWISSARNMVTATLHVAPQRLGFVNLNYFNPQPTTPDSSTHEYTGAVSDKWSIWGGIWENVVSATTFDAAVWAKGPLDLVIQPQVNSGNYFGQQDRHAKRYSWSSSFAFGQWNHWGSHSFKAGVYAARSTDNGQMIEHPIDIEDGSNHLLERIAFTGGTPYHNRDTELAVYEQDHWVLNPRVSMDLGLRFEHQEISNSLRLAPRGGMNWDVFPRFGTVIRAGIGIFYDRVPLGVYSFAEYPDRIVTYYDPNGAVAAGPFTYQNGLGEVVSRNRFVVTNNAPGNFSPRSTTGTIYVEQPVTRNLRLRAGYLQSVSDGLVILDSTVPDPITKTGKMLLSGTGTAHYRQYELTARVRAGKQRELFFSYVHSRATGDLNDFADHIGSFPVPIIHPNQVATLPTNLPNRFLAWGSLRLPSHFGLAPVFEYRNGFPYSVVNEQQRYVGTPNSNSFPKFLSADARVWRDFKVNRKYSVRLAISGFNLTNHFNPEAIHWNTADPAYGGFFGERHRHFTADFDVLF
jgi:hypothetical protein